MMYLCLLSCVNLAELRGLFSGGDVGFSMWVDEIVSEAVVMRLPADATMSIFGEKIRRHQHRCLLCRSSFSGANLARYLARSS